MTTKLAIEWAQCDARTIDRIASAEAARMAPDDCRIIVDGSLFSPSWRTLSGGDAVWHSDNASADDAAYLAYVETLDELTTDATHSYPNGSGFTMGWEDGCLFLYGPEYDHDETIRAESPDPHWMND